MSKITLDLDPGMADLVDATYSGYGPMATPDEALTPRLEQTLELLTYVTQLRHEFAVSGAMRWPWSQEAPILAQTRLIGP